MMGLGWISEVFSFISYTEIAFVVDLINTAQGVSIFLLFIVGRQRVLKLIKNRFVPVLATEPQ